MSLELGVKDQLLSDMETKEQEAAYWIEKTMELGNSGLGIPGTPEWSFDTETRTVVCRITQEKILPREEIEYYLHTSTLSGSNHPNLQYWEHAYIFFYQAGEENKVHYAAELFIPDKTIESGYQLFEPFDYAAGHIRHEPINPQ